MKKNISKIFAFDTEDNGKGDLLYIDIFDGKKHYGFTDKRKFYDFVIKNEGIYYAHNLQYDFNNLDLYKFSYCIWRTGRIIFAESLWNCSQFRDTFNLSFVSLATLGEKIDLPKLDIGLSKSVTFDINNKKHIEYSERDTEIVFYYVKSIRKLVSNYGLKKEKPTLAGTSFSIFKNFYSPILDKYSDEFRHFYFGGRVECFFIGAIKKKIQYSDVNSLYPYVMTKKFPFGQYYISKEIESESWLAEMTIESLPCGKTAFSSISYRYNERLVFPLGQFRVNLTSAEYGYIKDYINIKKIHKVYNFPESDYIFKDFMLDFYDKRKAEKGFNSYFYKLIMNSLYGRFGLKSTGECSFPESYFDLFQIEHENLEVLFTNPDGVSFCSDKIDVFQNLILASFITGYARGELFKLMETVEKRKGKMLYCDTDSVFYQCDEPLLTDFEGDGLGKLKSESGEFMQIWSAKEYIFNNKPFAKGVSKEFQLDYLNGKTVTIKKPIKYKESHRRKDKIKANVWIDIEKTRKNYYNKAQILPNGEVLPLYIKTY